MNVQSTDNLASEATETIESPKIKVLTPTAYSSENQYLTCLWSAVRACGVEVEAFNSDQVAAQLKAGQRAGDVIHINWLQRYCPIIFRKTPKALFYTLKYLYKFRLLKSQGYQLVWTVHNTLSHNSKAPFIEHCFRWAFGQLCDDIVVMSEYSKQEFAQLYGRKNRVHIIPHGNYIGAYSNQVSRVEARQKLGISAHAKVFLYFGQVKPYKGIDRLLEAFSQTKDSEALLLIAGSCNEAELAETIRQAAQIDSRMLLRLEFIKDEDIQIYLNACDWVVLPYQKILNSGSALLALSFSRPVIVPQQGSLTELIQDGEQGFCYLNDNLADAIHRALVTPHERWQQMCINAYVLAQQYDWSKIGAQFCQIYQQGR